MFREKYPEIIHEKSFTMSTLRAPLRHPGFTQYLHFIQPTMKSQNLSAPLAVK